MNCPRCKIGTTLITHLRARNHAVTRLRRCKNCKHKFLSYETLTPPEMHGIQEEKPASEEIRSERRLIKLRRIARKEAEETGRPYHDLCTELDVPLSRRMSPKDIERMHALRAEGASVRAIGAELKRNPRWIATLLRRAKTDEADTRTAA